MKNSIKTLFLIPFIGIIICISPNTNVSKPRSVIGPDCTFNGFKLYGKIKYVDAFPDIKVQVVDAFPDLNVKVVDAFPDECGKWQIVDAFPDIKVQFVTAFPDIKIKFVDAFPGVAN